MKAWDKRFGGTQDDQVIWFQQTNDNGYIVGGMSNSGAGGDKTQPNWDTTMATNDYWVVKIDSEGNKQWDKRFGGLGEDETSMVVQCTDNGYILSGTSFSGIGGDKTQPAWGGGDYWIVRTDAQGNKQWNARFGGTGADYISAAIQTSDRGYLAAGASWSGISGDKTQPNWDTTLSTADYWLVKMDSMGNKQWDKVYGGTAQDIMIAIIPTRDGGYLVGGDSESDSSGDKTQANWGLYANYWVVKIDSDGNKQWDRRYGGYGEDDLVSMTQTTDGGYILGGYSQSGIGGDKTTRDGPYWIIKIDSIGNKQWDKGFGAATEFNSVIQTNDGGYLLSGSSTYNAVGDKTENNLGNDQGWLVKTDPAGNKQWDKTIFTLGVNGGIAIQASDGYYVTASFTQSGIAGYKSQPNWDVKDSTVDYWIIKFCEAPTGISEITTKVQLNIYPNPFISELDITLAQTNLTAADFSICNMLGQTVYAQHETNLSPTYTKMLDLSYLPNGIYLVEVVIDGEVSIREVVKQ